MAHKKYRVRRHHSYFGHHRNPFDTEVATTAAWAIGGGVLSTWLPTMVVPSFSQGWGGVAATGVAAVAIGWAGEKFVSAHAGRGLLIGGLVATGGKLIAQLLGKQLVSFQMGQYTQTFFGPPYNSTGILQNTPSPYVPPAAAQSSTAAAMHGLLGRTGGGRMSRSRFAR